jgi:LacI family transcriptional regulator
VLVDRMSRTRDFASVSVDDKLGGRIGTEHLLATGRRRIAFIGGPAGLPQVRDRLAAVRKTLRAAGRRDVIFTETTAMDAGAGRAGAEQLLALPRRLRPDAIFGANDLVALGALQALTLAGVRVGEEIALLGYDDIDFAASAAIPLSSVRQPSHELGRRAASILLDVIAGRNGGTTPHITLKPSLVVRRSSAG